MVSITVRHVPEKARDELAARAARRGQSLQEHLLAALIEMAERPDVAEVLAQARTRKSDLGTRLPADDILALRDADRW